MNSASTTTHTASPEQERLARILDEYLVAIEHGGCISPEELLAKYPEDADRLRGYLSGLQLFHAAAVVPHDPVGTPREVGVPAGLQTIGDYRLIREIGRGGMGVVYEAWQVSLRRRVALKVLPFTSAHDAKQISRFKNEAQAAAQAQHPNIVPVFAIGQESNTHYYVMQLIEGQSLTCLLNELRNGHSSRSEKTEPNYGHTQGNSKPVLAHSKTTRASTETTAPMRASETADHIRVVARLGIQAAEALHAAHEIGIVHRDVKPSNLLLDDQGKLWVTDFGLARCRENSGLTQTGDVLGTMRYTSPEQALGRTALVDHRSDLYSLGLTLYELATLNHPADEIGDVQLLFDRNRPPVKALRHWNRNIPRDFETIVLKCMSEFPHERYTSAQELSEDLERFLEGRPIVASPPSPLTRATKWAKRRRGVVYAVAAVLLVAAVGLIANNFMLARETAATNRALSSAKDRLRSTGLVLYSFATEYPDQLAGVPGAEALRQKMIEDCIGYYQQFEQEARNDPSLAEDMAIAYGRLGGLYDKLGKRADAIESMQKSLTIWQDRVAAQPSNHEVARSLALSKNSLGLLLSDDGRHAEGLELLQDALKSQQALTSSRSEWPELQSDLAATHSNLGVVLRRSGQQTEAANEFQAAIKIAEPLAVSVAENETAARGLAAACYNLASLHEAGGSPSAAAEYYGKAIGYQRELASKFPIKRFYQADLARSYNDLGRTSSQSDDWKLTEKCFANAIRIQENLVSQSPLAGAYRHDLAISYNNLGLAQVRAKRFTEAETAFQKAVTLQNDLLGIQPGDAQLLNDQGSVWSNLASLRDRQQRLADASLAYQKSVEFKERALSTSAADASIRAAVSEQYHKYAVNLAAQGKLDEAIRVTADRGKLWNGNPDQLYAAAQDLAGVYRRIKSSEQNSTKSKCVEVAASLLRESIASGLTRDRLQDRSLSGLTQDVAFGKLLDVKASEFSPAN